MKTKIEISEVLLNSTKEELEQLEFCIECEEELNYEDKHGYIDGMCKYCMREHLAEREYDRNEF